MNDFKAISVVREGDNEVEIVHNPCLYPLIGKGKQGAVFKISADQCVKIYAKQEHALSEGIVLKAAQESGIAAKLYEVGEKFVIMEYIEGHSLKQYLESKSDITEDLVWKILFLLKEMKRLQFTRLDARLDHIIITKENELKVIDLVYSFSLEKQCSLPEKLLNGLRKLGLLSLFFEQVKKLDPEFYREWKVFEDYKSIRVASLIKGEKVEVLHNPTSFPLIGRGNQGAVFKISKDQCVKIYAKQMHVLSESTVLKAAQESSIVPRLYEVGENFIVMEYIEGPSLKEYLEEKGTITEDVTKKILFLLEEMKRLKFTRLDSRLKEIIVTKQGEMKVVDLVSHFTKNYDRPVKLMTNLYQLGLLSSFLDQVKHLDPQSYLEWKDFSC
ncbi:putative Ser/Thr protein kinase [Neobacillus niacini]|uniref:hypothetical protein n=1 Tax=Neobacillus niacini TaxID=86668 RepID=UPI00285CC5A6|nr:hypothetical protein [Neobacillus niacini]MDR7080247.1 putative Ser/Thr protein kinase [Neobacillus niacini]